MSLLCTKIAMIYKILYNLMSNQVKIVGPMGCKGTAYFWVLQNDKEQLDSFKTSD